MKRKLIVVLLMFICFSCSQSSNKNGDTKKSNQIIKEEVNKIDVNKLRGEWILSTIQKYPGGEETVESSDFLDLRDSNFYEIYNDDAMEVFDSINITGLIEKGEWSFNSLYNKITFTNRQLYTSDIVFCGSKDSVLNLYVKVLTDTSLELCRDNSKNCVTDQYERYTNYIKNICDVNPQLCEYLCKMHPLSRDSNGYKKIK